MTNFASLIHYLPLRIRIGVPFPSLPLAFPLPFFIPIVEPNKKKYKYLKYWGTSTTTNFSVRINDICIKALPSPFDGSVSRGMSSISLSCDGSMRSSRWSKEGLDD